MSQQIRVLLFGPLAEINTEKCLMIDGVFTVAELEQHLRSTYELFNDYTFRIAVNRKIVSLDHIISPSDEIAVLPPYSGG